MEKRRNKKLMHNLAINLLLHHYNDSSSELKGTPRVQTVAARVNTYLLFIERKYITDE